jgi:hypothetical protein
MTSAMPVIVALFLYIFMQNSHENVRGSSKANQPLVIGEIVEGNGSECLLAAELFGGQSAGPHRGTLRDVRHGTFVL